MEEGSLLKTALEHAKTLHNSSACESLLKNCIHLDLYTLGDRSRQVEDHLLDLAELAENCNRFFQKKNHLWHYGADGPVFGVHIDHSEAVPHLRAYCRYGPSVQDGWIAIHYVVEFMQSLRENSKKQKIVASAWDVQDGQVILIQLADLLPPWLDADPTDNHRYACWIDQNGDLQLLRQPHISLNDALKELRGRLLSTVKFSSNPKMQQALTYWLDLNAQAASVHQRAPMVLPRKVALAFRERPELLRTAIQAFCESIQQNGPVAPTISRPDLAKYEDWVWTVQTLPRTNYAMARSVSSVQDEWTSSPDSIPTLVGAEVKRYRRQCKVEAMGHLKHAVALGVRAVIGLEELMDANDKQYGTFFSSSPLSSLEERIMYWSRIQQTSCGLDKNENSKTILESFQMGPNTANLDLTNILRCPVYPEEAENWTSYSKAQVSLQNQVKNIMRSQNHNKNVNDVEAFWVPRPDQVDPEDWMDYEHAKIEMVDELKSEHDVDNLLSRFQSFLQQKSNVDGINSNKTNGNGGRDTNKSSSKDICPRVFLTILHSVLKGKKLDFRRADPFFYEEDYDLIEQDGDSESSNNNDRAHEAFETADGSFSMNDIMSAMDNELEGRTESRRIPSSVLNVSDIYPKNSKGKDTVKGLVQDAHILSNLMESLDASGGGSGPVRNIIKEMEGEA